MDLKAKIKLKRISKLPILLSQKESMAEQLKKS